ncbi:MAG TPA: DegT/DnrJ/EryC1/StrS family aminotransferase [Pseudolabrys sp.]|nr:DegT/DnrJ/EryC1/StrS family aminotransferase [Pseudolabrys sp.]
MTRTRLNRFRAVAKQRIAPISYLRLLTGGCEEDEARFRAAMRARFGADTHIVPFGRARSGIYLLVKFAVWGGRRKVLLSPYTIPDVVTMVLLAGGEPVFFDFEPASTACDIAGLERLIDGDTACVMVTHHHVNEPRLTDIQDLCRARGVYLFDDCAIAFGGSIGGHPLGTLTDASVFSMSSFKTLNFFWGGMVATRNEAVAQFLQREMAPWPRLAIADYWKPAKACLQYDLASSPPLFDRVVFPLLARRAQKSGFAQSLENTRLETERLTPTLTSRPALAAFAEWNGKLAKVDKWLAHRRAIARVYARTLGEHMVGPRPDEAAFAGACFVNFPLNVTEQRRDVLCRDLMLAGLDVGKSLYPNVHRHPKFDRLPGHSANVDRLAKSTIYLPTHFGVSEAYATELALTVGAHMT